MRKPALVAAATIVAVTSTTLLGLTGPASAASTKRLTVEGAYQHVIADRVDGRHASFDVVETPAGESHRVALPKGPKPKPGAKVKITGAGSSTAPSSADAVVAETVVVEGPVDAVVDASPTSTQRVLIMLAQWTQPDAVTPESAAQQFFVDDDAWFREASYGAVGLSGDVTPWLQIAGPDNGLCLRNAAQTMEQAKAAATAAGFALDSYDRFVLYFPRSENPDCAGYAGWAHTPGTHVWLNGKLTRGTTVHELGHNLGLLHAHAYTCSDGSTQLTIASAGCTSNEYGDVFDVMGRSYYGGHFSAAHKAQLGWVTGRVADLSAGGTAALVPVTAAAGTMSVKIETATRTYWLEYRDGSGMDAALPATVTEGVLVRVVDTSVANGVGLLDATPDGLWNDAGLRFNSSWQTPEGLWVTVGQPSAGVVPVTVGDAPVDTVAPGEVTGLAGLVSRASLTVTWINPLDRDYARTVVRVTRDGTDPRGGGEVVASGALTSVSLAAPARRETVRILVTTVDETGNASSGREISASGRILTVVG